jgi:predicted component of type VI protein secretion system
MASTYRLILQSGTSMGAEYPLDKTELILGRDMGNDLVINDPEVSRRHLKFVLEGVTYRIEDLGSTNGTFIHGQRLSAPVILRPGDIITLGEKVVLRYEVSTSDPNATVAVQRSMNQGTQAAVQRSVAPPPSAPIPAAPIPMAPIPAAAPPAQSYQPIQAAPVYPPGNMSSPAMPSAAPRKKSKGLIILLVIVGIIVLFCVIPFIIIDLTNSYCSLAPGIMNMLFTGACP